MREKMIEAMKNPELVKALKSGIMESIIEALKQTGIDCTEDDIMKMFTPDESISEEELANVSGINQNDPFEKSTEIICTVFVTSSAASFM